MLPSLRDRSSTAPAGRGERAGWAPGRAERAEARLPLSGEQQKLRDLGHAKARGARAGRVDERGAAEMPRLQRFFRGAAQQRPLERYPFGRDRRRRMDERPRKKAALGGGRWV